MISMDIDASKSQEVEITLKNTSEERGGKKVDKEDKVTMTFDPTASTFVFDRTDSGLDNFSLEFPATTVAPTFSTDRRLSLEIYIDHSSIEIFGNGGKFAMTNLVFPTKPYDSIEISTPKGYARVENLTISPIELD